jgi:hypothetical protein
MPDTFPEGLYHAQVGGSAHVDNVVFVVRDWRVRGFGLPFHEGSSRYEGICSFDAARSEYTIRVSARYSPGVLLATGHRIGPEGAEIDFEFVCRRPDPVARFRIQVMGKAVDVALTYVCALPRGAAA